MIKLVVFDLDGVLIEAKQLHYEALNDALNLHASDCVISWNEHLSKYDGLKTKQKLEMLSKEILQYFAYFIRPDFSQKPDVDIATEKYKAIADSRTVEELREIVGRKHTIDFAALGSERIEIDSDRIVS
jgi:beta-phosphoglucomutase-like phosphatase (HAD superfamily)